MYNSGKLNALKVCFTLFPEKKAVTYAIYQKIKNVKLTRLVLSILISFI